MTLREAQRIIELVATALQDTRHRHIPVSALAGHDLYDFDSAAKLTLANEFLLLSGRLDFEEVFNAGIMHYGRLPALIIRHFVADNQVDQSFAGGALNPYDLETLATKDQRFANLETIESFGKFCRSTGADNPLFWQRIYTRLDLDYTTTSPRVNEASDCQELKKQLDSQEIPTTDPFHASYRYLATILISGLFAATPIVSLLFVSQVLTEVANWMLAALDVSARLSLAMIATVATPALVKMLLSYSSVEKANRRGRQGLSSWWNSTLIALALAVFVYSVYPSTQMSYTNLLAIILFLICYPEAFLIVSEKGNDPTSSSPSASEE